MISQSFTSRGDHVIPDTLSRLFAFEKQQETEIKPMLTPICRNVPDDPALQTHKPNHQFQIAAEKLDNLQPVQSDRELFTVKSVYVSSSSVFISVDQKKLLEEQAKEYGPYIQYIMDKDAPIPEKETITSMSHYSVKDGVLYKSHLPAHMKQRSTIRDQLVLPKSLVGFVLHSYHDHAEVT